MLWYNDPFTELERMQRDLDKLFTTYNVGRSSFPLVNIYDRKDDVVVHAELPGVAKDTVDVTYTDGVLTLSGTREDGVDRKKYTAVREERPEGNFEKSFRIPYRIEQDKVNASFQNGVLTITLPKAEEAKPKQIKVDVE
jgi:HSP20 family protein